MLDLSKIINQPGFKDKYESMIAAYHKLDLQKNGDGAKFYGLHDRLDILSEAFDGELIIDVDPAPLNNAKFVVIKASLSIATDAGFQPVLSRHGRSSLAIQVSQRKDAQDLDKMASNNAIGRVLDAIGMPANVLSSDSQIGEYEALELKLKSLGMAFDTAVLNYNMHTASTGNVETINKTAPRDLNVDELRRLMFTLPNVATEDDE